MKCFRAVVGLIVAALRTDAESGGRQIDTARPPRSSQLPPDPVEQFQQWQGPHSPSTLQSQFVITRWPLNTAPFCGFNWRMPL